MSLMEYLPPAQAPQQRQAQPQQGGAGKFHGEVVEQYDAKRETTDKWIVEQKIITDWLSELPPGSVVLDAPVGTGRFLKHMVEKKLRFVGLDIQPDMLVKAALKVLPQEHVETWVQTCNQRNELLPLRIKDQGQDQGTLGLGDVLKTGAPDKEVDVAVNCRITRWLIQEHGPEGIRAMLREMQRVARKQIILTARVANHRFAVTEDLINSALDGWKITRNEAGYVTDYRIVMIEPT